MSILRTLLHTKTLIFMIILFISEYTVISVSHFHILMFIFYIYLFCTTSILLKLEVCFSMDFAFTAFAFYFFFILLLLLLIIAFTNSLNYSISSSLGKSGKALTRKWISEEERDPASGHLPKLSDSHVVRRADSSQTNGEMMKDSQTAVLTQIIKGLSPLRLFVPLGKERWKMFLKAKLICVLGLSPPVGSLTWVLSRDLEFLRHVLSLC